MNFIASQARSALALLALLFAVSAHAQLAPGKDYRVINPPQPTDSGKRVEVLEFFWYGCPHCSALQAPLRVWLKQKPADVEFKRVPAVLGDSSRCTSLLGPPEVDLERLCDWVASWVSHGGRSLGKPTHFESTDGRF